MSKVAIMRCNAYELGDVKERIKQGLDLLGGLGAFVSPGERVLLKVNCLNNAPVEKAVTTHPIVLRAVIQLLAGYAGEIVVSDSPGYMSFQVAARNNGFLEACRAEGVPLVEIGEEVEVEYPGGILYKRFRVGSLLKRVDKVINLPKLKTHSFMYLTGCVKNMFGVIPGKNKAAFHLKANMDKFLFARMLVDLYRACPPTFNIVDGIIGMEGDGPGSGDPVQMGVLLLGVDGFAVDETMARLVGASPERVPVLAIYRKYVLEGRERPLELVGDSLQSARYKGFRLPSDVRSTLPEWAYTIGKNLLAPKQVFIEEKCIRCRICVDGCPTEALLLDPKKGVVCDYRKCIRCFVCQEMCPARAIEIRKPPLAFIIR